MIRLEELSREELLDLIKEYDSYIQEANEEDRYSDGWYPVCINEFLNNDYPLIKEEKEEDK